VKTFSAVRYESLPEDASVRGLKRVNLTGELIITQE